MTVRAKRQAANDAVRQEINKSATERGKALMEKSRTDREKISSDNKMMDDIGMGFAGNAKITSNFNAGMKERARITEVKRKEDQNAYERWYEKNISGKLLGKIAGSLEKADKVTSNVKAGVLDTATLGATQGVGRAAIKDMGQDELSPFLNDRLNSTSYKVGQFGGYIAPGVVADRLVVKAAGKLLDKMPKVARGFARGAAAGSIDTAAQEVGDVAFREGQFDPINVGLGAGIGGGLGAAIPIIAPWAKKAYSAFKNRGRAATPEVEQGIQELLALPAPRARGNVNQAQSPDVVYGRGKVKEFEPLGLPAGNPVQRTKFTVAGNNQALNKVMNDIKPEVEALITPPDRRDLLIDYIERNIGIPKNEIWNMPMKDLQDLGSAIRQDMDVASVAFDAARKRGYDLPSLLNGDKPSVGNSVAQNAQERAYGVYPKDLPNVKTPQFTRQTTGNLASPVERVGRAPLMDANPFVAATRAEAPSPAVRPRIDVTPNEPTSGSLNSSPRPVSTNNGLGQRGIRGNFANQLNNGNLSAPLQRAIRNTDQTYDIKTNQASLDAADEALKDMPYATSKFLNNDAGGAEHIATGIKLMKRLDSLGRHEEALAVSTKLAEDLTKSGQTSQAASILSRLSPEGQLLNLIRQAERNGRTVSVADSVKFKDLAAKAQQNAGAGIRENQYNTILNKMEKGENVTVAEIKELSDYLSGAEKVIKPPKPVKVVDDTPSEFKDVKKRERIVSFLDDVEQAALARIAGRRNNLNALPVNEWADHAIVVAAQLAKGTVKAASHVDDLVRMFGEEIRPYATQVFQSAQKIVRGVSGGAGQNDLLKANKAFERISGQPKVMNNQEKIVEKYLKENPKVSQADIDKLRNLSKSVTKLSNDAKIGADIEMQKILNSYEKSSAWDKTLAVRYMGMLLNTHTQAINALSGPIMASTGVVADTFGAMLDIGMSTLLKKPRTTTLYGTNPLRFIAGYMKNLKVGAKAGFQGVNPAGIQSTNEIRGLAFKSKYNPLGWAERTLGAVAKGADYATYKTVFDTELRKQGYLSAKSAGIKGKQNIDKHVREFVNDPPEEAILQADRIGKNTTFQRADSTGGKVANFLNNSPTLVKPGVNAIFPFVRTPINIASTAVTMTPAGIIKGLFQLTSKSQASQREAIRTMSMGLTGTGIGAIGFYLSKLGIITGANDSGNKDADNIREQAGKGKYRFNTSALNRYLGALVNGEGADAAEKAAQYREGDKQFDYNKLQPLAFPLAIGAGVDDNKDKGVAGQVTGAGGDAFGSLFGMSTLKGVQQVFQPSYGGTQGEKALGVPTRIAESFFKSFSWGGLAQEAKRQDPIQRKTPFNDGIVKNTEAYFKSRIPGLSKELPARKTTLGQDYKNMPGVKGAYLNPYRSEVAPYNKAAEIISGLIDRTGDLTLAPSAPAKTVRGKDKSGLSVSLPIPAERYAQLQEDVGNEIVKRVTELPKMDDAKLATKIMDIYSKVREREMNKIKRELGIRIS